MEFAFELIKEASENAHVIDLGDSDYVLLSEEEVAQEIEEQKKEEDNNDGEKRQDG